MVKHTQDKFLTVQEVSDVLRLSVLTIYKYIKSGRIGAVEFGGHYRILESSLNNFVRKSAVKSGGNS
jgi:excisionase family DNA binding protein